MKNTTIENLICTYCEKGVIYIYNSFFSIENCSFSGNKASNGGGIFVDDKP